MFYLKVMNDKEMGRHYGGMGLVLTVWGEGGPIQWFLTSSILATYFENEPVLTNVSLPIAAMSLAGLYYIVRNVEYWRDNNREHVTRDLYKRFFQLPTVSDEEYPFNLQVHSRDGSFVRQLSPATESPYMPR